MFAVTSFQLFNCLCNSSYSFIMNFKEHNFTHYLNTISTAEFQMVRVDLIENRPDIQLHDPMMTLFSIHTGRCCISTEGV